MDDSISPAQRGAAATADGPETAPRPVGTAALDVFVLLPFGQGLAGDEAAGLAQWADRHARGLAAEATPYGYGRAAADGIRTRFSVDRRRGRAATLWRRIVLRLTGMDLVHVWRNRDRVADAAMVWTHTEREHLALLLLQRLRLAPARPVLAQSVWLFERWERLWRPRRALWRRLLRGAAVVTTLSPVNRELAERMLGRPVAMVPFGIDPEAFRAVMPTRPAAPADRPARLLGVGNDRDRDWAGLIEAMRRLPGGLAELEILSPRADDLRRRLPAHPAVTCRRASLAEVRAAYAGADRVVLPLRENRHASGITVLLEAAAAGMPVIATRTGGIDAYLDDAAVAYAPPGDPAALAEVIRADLADPAGAARRTAEARRQVAERGLTSADYVRAHCVLTRRYLTVGAMAAA